MMTPPSLRPTPPLRGVIGAQFRAVGLTIWPSAVVAGALVAVVLALLAMVAFRTGEGLPLLREMAGIVALTAAVLPIVVWKGEHRFRRSYLASLPVDLKHHALAKIAAGWVWLMALTAAFVLAMLAVTVATGGAIGLDEMRVSLRDLPPGAPPADLAPFARRWTTPGWHWAVFFTGATVAYLFGSAVVLAGSGVQRWLVGLVFVMVCLIILAEPVGVPFGVAADGFEWVAEGVVGGPYGVLSLFAAASDYLLTTASGEVVPVWGDPPTLGEWAIATLLWTGLALASVLVVVRRNRKG